MNADEERRFEITYCLAKQLGSMSTIETNYGSILLDEEMREAVAKALRKKLEARLRALENKK